MTLFAIPVIGAVVGYCTNYITVKMLFRPLREVRIAGIKVPFTPGIIPKKKDEIIGKLAGTVSSRLISGNQIAEHVLESNLREKFADAAAEEIKKFLEERKSFYDLASGTAGKDKTDSAVMKGKTAVVEYIQQRALELELGDKIVKRGAEAVKEKMNLGFLSMFINDSMIDGLVSSVSEKADQYINENLKEDLWPVVDSEADRLLKMSPSDIGDRIRPDYEVIRKIACDFFDDKISERIYDLFSVDVEAIVAERMADMDVLEIEEILMALMKKELNYVINLGALIGFLLGLVSLLPSL